MTLRKSRVFVALAAVLVLSLALVGCGGGGDKGGDNGGDTTTLTIGIGAPLTQGSVAIGQGAKRGVELAIDVVNKSDEAKEAGIQFPYRRRRRPGRPQDGRYRC